MKLFTLFLLTQLFNTKTTLGQNPEVPASFIVFMAPECPICQFYIPLLKTYSEQPDFQKKYFTLAFTTGDSAAIGQFERKYRTGWKLAWGAEAKQLARQYQASVTPELVVLNQNQNMQYRGRLNDAYAAPGRRRYTIRVSEIDTLYQAYLRRYAVNVASQPAIGCLMNP